MKLIRWVEVRLIGRKHRNNSKNKDRANTNFKNNDIRSEINVSQSKCNATTESLVCQTYGSPTFSLQSEQVCDLPNASPFNVFRKDKSVSLAQEPQQSKSSLSLATPKSRERSRIKTNPWLQSPWLMRQTYGSSSSTDSGYDCIANNKTVLKKNDEKDLVNINLFVDKKSTNGCYALHENESSSEEFANSTSSSSNSVFSSSSNSIISETNETVWSTSTLPNSLSTVTVESGQWSTPSQSSSSLGQCNDNNKTALFYSKTGVEYKNYSPKSLFASRCDSSKNSIYNRINGSELRNPCRKKRSTKIMSASSKLSRGNERWISLATEMSSSDEEFDDLYVPSPAPPDRQLIEYQRSNNSWRHESNGSHFNREINLSTRETINFNETYSSDFEYDLMNYFTNCNNRSNHNSIDSNFNVTQSYDALAKSNQSIVSTIFSRNKLPISPQADSAIGMSEEMSSTSTTPSVEMKQCSALDRNSNSNELSLDEKVRQLRIELRDIVDVAFLDARQEELRLRESRIALQRELLKCKSLLLIQTLAGLRQRLQNNDNIY
jgi:hypothetical protein